MIMKRILIIISLFMMLLAGCGNGGKKYDTALDFLSIEEASNILGYTPLAEEENTRLEKRVTYKNENKGEGDIIRVSIYPPNTKYSADDIKQQFNSEKKRNEDYKTLIEVEEADADVFISIPSVHIYKNGHYAVITAGAGGDDKQINLLKDLSRIVIGHLNELKQVTEEVE